MIKSLKLIILFFAISNYSFSQNENSGALIVDGKLNIDSIYQKKDELIIVSGIHSFDSISKIDLIKKVKQWGGTKFVNLKEVLVGETEDQLVFNYITNSYYIKTVMGKDPIPWYIRLVIQFKDGKIRCTYYDDGNVTMISPQGSPGPAARTIKLKDYFKEKDGVFINNTKSLMNGLEALRKSIDNDFTSIKEDILKGESKTNDW
jgi:hypothetical protein